MKKYYLLVFILFIGLNWLSAQQIQIIDSDQPMVLPDGKVGTASIEGSPFLNKDYVAVVLNNMDGSTMQLDQGRFNAYAQKIEVIKNNEKIWVNDHQLAGFELKIGGKSHKYSRFIIEQQTHYLEELVQGKQPLLMLSKISVNEPKQQDNTSYNKETSGVYKYTLPKITFFTIKEGRLSIVPTNKKKFVESMASKHRKLIEAKLKKDKLKTGKQEDLETIFTYINTNLISE